MPSKRAAAPRRGRGGSNAHRSLRVLTLNVWGLKYFSKQRTLRLRAIADRLGSVPAQPLSLDNGGEGEDDGDDNGGEEEGEDAGTTAEHTRHDGDHGDNGEEMEHDDDDAYDVIALQEIWVESEDWRYMRARCAERYPYSKFFYTAALGSGLAILSRYPIVATHTQAYLLNGVPLYVSHGDWIAGKAFGSVTISHPRLGLVDIYNTHTIAAGGEDGPESKRAHRVAQAWELATKVRESAELGRHAIVVGDINSTPPSLTVAVLRDVGGLHDAFLASHPSLPPHAVSLPSSTSHGHGHGGGPPDPHRAIAELGVTCDSPLNTWTAGKPLDARARAGAGKRLDYIFWRGPKEEGRSMTSPSRALLPASGSRSQDAAVEGSPERIDHDPRGRLRCARSAVVFTERLTHRPDMSFSDHFGLSATFTILDDESGSTTTTAAAGNGTSGTGASPGAGAGAGLTRPTQRRQADSKTLQTLTSALHALSGASHTARKLQHSHYLALGASLGAALLLVVLAAVLPGAGPGARSGVGTAAQGGVHAVIVLLAVVAGFAGTTMLYSGFIAGEWEKRSLRTIMESIELELGLIKHRLNETSAFRSSEDGAGVGSHASRSSSDQRSGQGGRTGRGSIISTTSSKRGHYEQGNDHPLGTPNRGPAESLI